MTTRTIGSGIGSTGAGTVSTVSTTAVVGTGTNFTVDFALPSTIQIAGVLYDVATITDNTHLTTSQTQGTNTNVAYKLGLRQYSTLAQWAAKVNTVDVGAGGSEIGNCYNDAEFAPTAQIGFGGWTNADATHTVTLNCASGQSFRDNASVQSNALRYTQANGVGVKATFSYNSIFSITGTQFTLDGLQVKSTGTNNKPINLSNSALVVTIQNCIFEDNAAQSCVAFSASSTSLIQNCAIIQHSNGGGNGLSLTTSTAYDCTIVASNSATGTGLAGTTSAIAVNCAVSGFTTDYSGTAGTGTKNNATDKATFGGTGWGTTGGQINLVGTTEYQSVTNNLEDLRLNSTSAKLKDNGFTGGPTTDIAGTSRPQPGGGAYDIGCWELVAAAGTDIIPLWQQLTGITSGSYGLRI